MRVMWAIWAVIAVGRAAASAGAPVSTDSSPKPRKRRQAAATDEDDRVPCPRCEENVKSQAEVCRFCRADLINGVECGECETYCDAQRCCEHMGVCSECNEVVERVGSLTADGRMVCSDCRGDADVPENRAQ